MCSSKLRALTLFLIVALQTQAATATQHRSSHQEPEDVQPSPAIEARVASEVAKARGILDTLSPNNFAASPYLVSAVYYHDGFLNDFEVNRTTADPNRRIIGRISQMLTPESKARYVRAMHDYWSHSKVPTAADFVFPVAHAVISTGSQDHQFAIDLFGDEGDPIVSSTRGIVLVADSGWNPADPLSSTSRKGGNSIIIFAPDEDRFYRYCHLNSVQVSPGQIVAAGQRMATVGHTGLNASLRGHGQHLHFEANTYSNGHVTAIDYRRLRSMLHAWQQTASR